MEETTSKAASIQSSSEVASKLGSDKQSSR